MRHPSITANCKTCGAVFHPLPHKVKAGQGRFCSRPCSDKMRMGGVEERFWRNVTKSDGCWIYRNVSTRGYGKLLAHGKHVRANRVAWEMANGAIPEGLLVCHSCDNPSCVRLDHLFLGTNADNAADCAAKGRHAIGAAAAPKNPARGERTSTAVLNAAAIKRIRKLYAVGGYSQQAIAYKFGVDQTQVSRIVRRVAWAHIN